MVGKGRADVDPMEGWVCVYGVAQEIEADIVVGLLEEEGIPVLKRYPGAGEFLKLASGLTSGVDIYVPEASALRAGEILERGDTLGVEASEDEWNAPPQSVADESREEAAEKVSETRNPGAGLKGKGLPWAILVMIVLLAVALLVQHRGLFWQG